jgi:single-stranded-DNA-specific exonuclease
MPPTSKRWSIQPAAPEDFTAQFPNLHHLLLQILFNRGVTAPEAVDAFLSGRIRVDDPYRMLGMTKAVERIRAAIQAGERMVVYGDFDADGVTSTALLIQTLRALGGQAGPYIPHRVDEGYGLNCGAMDKIAATGAKLIITVDCGIRSPVEAAYAAQLGMDMIITDHHSIAWREGVGQEVPAAYAVLNPRQDGCPYPEKELAGVGIAFKLAQALLLAEQQEPMGDGEVELSETDLLDLVALGTVSDVAVLLGENRSLVQRGLVELNKPRRPGVRAMLDESHLSSGRINATDIGFVLGPRLNAAGRLKSASISYKLLTATDDLTARPLATELGELNRQRQTLTQQLVVAAKEMIAREQHDRPDRYLYLVSGPGFNPGIVGLVAGRLTEELYRPTLVARVEDGITHGSARSIAEFDITRALDMCRELLGRYGGHAMAAGFTVDNDKLPALQEKLEDIATNQLAGQALQPTLLIDVVTPLDDLDWATLELLAQLEPCGHANPQPVLASYGLEVTAKRRVGQTGDHLKLTVRDPNAPGLKRMQVWDAIAFRQGAWADEMPERIDLAYTLECNEFNGERRLQLNVKDIRVAAGD